jgi:hypothetical protein
MNRNRYCEKSLVAFLVVRSVCGHQTFAASGSHCGSSTLTKMRAGISNCLSSYLSNKTWTSLACRSASISFTLVNRGYE